MDLPAPDRRPAARGQQLVSSWRLRNTPARRASGGTRSGKLTKDHVSCVAWQLPFFIPARSASHLLMVTEEHTRMPWKGGGPRPPPAKTNRCKRMRCHELNADALSDVLFLLPAKDLCRLCAVCSSWCSATIDPHFITKHKLNHSEPLFLAKFRNDLAHIHVVDMSGRVVKTMADTSVNNKVLFTCFELACMATDWNICRVPNPATGAFHVLPQNLAPEHANLVNLSNPCTFFTLGRVTSTGEYKVIRMFRRPGFMNLGQQLFEVYAINGRTVHLRWRARQNPEHLVQPTTGVVIDGVVHFLAISVNGIPPDYIMSFHLRSEEWRRDITVTGPISWDTEALKRYHSRWDQLSLAELKGSLVLVYYHQGHCSMNPYAMDLWFLTDFENGTWVKKYSIAIFANPLSELDDGRLVLYQTTKGLLHIYNPETKASEVVHMRLLDSVVMFTGSRLSLQLGDMV